MTDGTTLCMGVKVVRVVDDIGEKPKKRCRDCGFWRRMPIYPGYGRCGLTAGQVSPGWQEACEDFEARKLLVKFTTGFPGAWESFKMRRSEMEEGSNDQEREEVERQARDGQN